MPGVGIGAAIASAVGLAGTQATIAAVVINTAVTLAATGIYSALNTNKDDRKSRFEPPKSSGFSDGTEIPVRAVISPQRFILGEASLAGVYDLTNTSKEGVVYEGDQAEHNDLPGGPYLVHQYLLAGHEIEGVTGMRIGETDLFVDEAGNATGGDFDYKGTNIRASFQKGGNINTQRTDKLIRENFPDIDPVNFAHWGHATATVEYYYGENDEDHREIYGGSIDPVFRVKGAKCYDPRDSNQERWNPETWKWTDNAVLLTAWLLTQRKFARGVDYLNIDLDILARSAEICEQGIEVRTSDGGVKFIPQFTINGVCDTSERQLDILTDMLTSCFGRLIYGSNGYHIYAGEPQESQGTITEDWLADGFEFAAGKPEETIVNKIRGRFISVDANYFRQDAPVLESNELETADGIENPKTINYRFTEDPGRVQRLMKLSLEHNRLQRALKIVTDKRGLMYDAGKPIDIYFETFTYVNGKYMVDEINMSGDANRFEFILTETADEQFNWDYTQDQRDYELRGIF